MFSAQYEASYARARRICASIAGVNALSTALTASEAHCDASSLVPLKGPAVVVFREARLLAKAWV